MKTRADIVAVRSFASLLTFSSLRDAVALPSVWLRPGPLKTAAVNRFRSDYPLYLPLMIYRSLNTPVGHEVPVQGIAGECVWPFCFDVVKLFPGSLTVENDRDHHSGFQTLRGFAPVVADLRETGCDRTVSDALKRACRAPTLLHLLQDSACFKRVCAVLARAS